MSMSGVQAQQLCAEPQTVRKRMQSATLLVRQIDGMRWWQTYTSPPLFQGASLLHSIRIMLPNNLARMHAQTPFK